ncbi:MAG: hypothetical protein JO339_33160 [Alphaproteobacteria bacterium]|nr:hypothetical protein [Alphaproteobacteria bacterium]
MPARAPRAAFVAPPALRLAAGDDDDADRLDDLSRRRADERDELGYVVELWDEAGRAVEQVLAITVNSSIGFAAYFAATREHPNRYLTLRHKNAIVTRWNGPKN